MKKNAYIFCAAALIGAFCAVFVACNEPPEPAPEPEDILVETDFVIVNGLEYPSDIAVELKDGRTITVAPGDERVIHTYGEIAHNYNSDGTPVVNVPYEKVIPDVVIKAYGSVVPAEILALERWTASGEKTPGDHAGADYRYTVTLTVTNEILKALEGPEPDTHITEYTIIANSLDSDITIDLRNGWSMTIKPGDEKEVRRNEYTFPHGVAFDRDRLLYADMIIRGEVVHESIWWLGLHWDQVREDGKDEYHFSRRFSLNVTEELLEKFRNSENQQNK